MTETTMPKRSWRRSRREIVRRLWNAFKTVAILFSFLTNVTLLIVLLLSPGPLFGAKTDIAEPLLDDLDAAFAALGKTVISTTIGIDHPQPVNFDLPLQQYTDVVLTEPVPLQAPATFHLPGGGGAIHGTVSLNLPPGMRMPVSLDLTVPVSSTIQVQMEVPVRIPLETAGMGPAIQQLRAVFRPLRTFLHGLPSSLDEAIQR